MLTALRSTNLVLIFLLELAALAALGYWGVHTGESALTKVLLGGGVPLVAAIGWGLFLAPKATYPLPVAGVLLGKLVVFGGAVAALAAADRVALAWIFGAAVVLTHGLGRVWER